jgi:hypothetical protein
VCFGCAMAARGTGSPLAPVVPVSTCPIPGPLYTVLRDYKDAPAHEARRHFSGHLAHLLAAFIDRHGPCLERVGGGPLPIAVPVPSSERPGPPPLRFLADAGLSLEVVDALRRGPATPRHFAARADGFSVRPDVERRLVGRRVLVLDDTLVTGSRAQSAAAALRRAGARSAVVLVVGRVVRPEASGIQAAYWRRARSIPYDPSTCCLSGCAAADRGEWPRPGGQLPMWSAGTEPIRPAS